MYYSPLRYPGGKSKIAPIIKKIITDNNLTGCTFVEPFAGGAGVSLDLLFNGLAKHIILNDSDIAVYSFWKAILEETNRFVEDIYNIPLIIKEWEHQKEILKSSKEPSYELGFATFYLNRTNRSGILNAGVIGGKKQDGKWKMDARFNRNSLAIKIRNIAERKGNITVYNLDFKDFAKYIPNENAFVYLDPPYYEKGKQLYSSYFNKEDHVELEKIIRTIQVKWLLTYDNHEEIKKIYKDYKVETFDINYSVSKQRKASEIMIYKKSNKPICGSSQNQI